MTNIKCWFKSNATKWTRWYYTNVFITEEAKETILDFSQRKHFSQLNNLKSGLKDGTKVTLKLSSNIVGDSNEDNNFPHRLLLTNTKGSKFRKAFANHSSGHIKLSKT